MAPPVDIVGREEELDALGHQLARARLVTVTGPPGVGKSTLARAFAARRDGRRRKPLAPYVALSGVATADRVCREIARVLRLPVPVAGAPAVVAAQVGRALAHLGRAVLVLDDVDDARAIVGDLVASWLAESPELRVIVTSRARLAVPGEARLALAPLPVPAVDETDPQRIADADAVRLFVRRAASVRPGYTLAPEAARSVGAIVAKVEGIPLAVELCAARIALLREHEIEDMLGAQLELLTQGSAPSPLSAAVACSWEQLQAHEATVLAGCSTFRGTFDLDAAVEVVAGETATLTAAARRAARLRLVDALTRLVEASLVRVEDAPSSAARRYAVPETIRVFAALRLDESDGRDGPRLRHAVHFAGLASRRPTLDQLALDHDNLEAALATALERGRPDLAAQILVALRPLALARGPLGPYLVRLDELLASEAIGVAARAELLVSRGLARIFRGQRDDALDDLARGRVLAQEAGLPAVEVLATSKRGLVLGLRGDATEAHRHLLEARARSAAIGDPHLAGVVRKDLANVLSEEGRDDEAIVELVEARALFAEAGDAREEGFVLVLLGMRLLDQGRLDDARRDLGSAIGLLGRAGDLRTRTWARAVLALVDLEAGDAGRARSALEDARIRMRVVGDEHTEGLLAAYLGNVALEQGMLQEADGLYREAQRALARAGDHGALAMAIAAGGLTQARLGRIAAARASVVRAHEELVRDARPPRAVAIAILDRGIEAIAAGGEPEPAALEAVVGRSARLTEEIRFALRVARHAPAASTTAAPQRSGEVVVAHDGAWLRLPGRAESLQIGRAGALRRIVQHLAEERLRRPGRSSSPQALVRVGWPGERILPAAARNRLHVSIARLRRLGMADLLLHQDDGYLLDPQVPVRVLEEGSAPPPPGP